MSSKQRPVSLDYAPPPGELLALTIEGLGISARELARRCGRSPKLITEVMSGKATLEPETALQFERVLGVEASIWLGMEAEYRLRLARNDEEALLSSGIKWLKNFPLADLEKRRVLDSQKPTASTVGQLLKFFGVASVEACEEYCDSLGVSYRHSPTFSSDHHSLYAWLRLGEIEAQNLDCSDFERAKFLAALDRVRSFSRTNHKDDDFLKLIQQELAPAGVAFVVIKPLGKMALSGVSRWLTSRKALIQQTLRHMSDDHFWFTLFHEAAHLLLHSRKTVFVDGRKDSSGTAQEEAEANKWATEFLIPRHAMAKFCQAGKFSEQSVSSFAEDLGIAPGIVVGQLQNAGCISYGYLNQLKVRFEWTE